MGEVLVARGSLAARQVVLATVVRIWCVRVDCTHSRLFPWICVSSACNLAN